MAVRVVHDYWTNISSYRTLISRCFTYLYRKFPNPQEGRQDSYQEVLIRLYELNVFSKFDPRRILASSMKMTKKQAIKFAEGITVEDAEKELKTRGINLDKKFEQFIYKWIEHVLGEAYHNRLKQSYRFVPSGDLDYNETTIKDVRDKFSENSWAQTPEELDYLQKHIIKKDSNEFVRQYPTPGNIQDFTGSKMGDPLEELVAKDLQEKIRGGLPTKKFRTLFDCTLSGMNGSEVGKAIKKNPQQAHQMLRKIRAKTAVMAY